MTSRSSLRSRLPSSMRPTWARALRTIVVAGLLVLALAGAVLSSVGSGGHFLDWAHVLGASATLEDGLSTV